MLLGFLRTFLLVSALDCLFQAGAIAQVMVNLGTASNASGWSITGAGTSGATALQVGGQISITSNGFSTGTFLSGGSLASFDGFWSATSTFSIPAGATSVSLSFSNLIGDDRVVLQLNGVNIGNVGISGSTGQPVTGSGLMRFVDPGMDNPFTFTSTQSGTVTTGFTIGGANTLTLIVNNTGNGLTGATRAFQTTTDFTGAGVTATLTYTPLPVPTTPAPPTSILAGTAMVALLGWFWRRQPRQAS